MTRYPKPKGRPPVGKDWNYSLGLWEASVSKAIAKPKVTQPSLPVRKQKSSPRLQNKQKKDEESGDESDDSDPDPVQINKFDDDLPSLIKISGAGSADVNGKYTRCEYLPDDHEEDTDAGYPIYSHNTNPLLYIASFEKTWFICHYQPATKDYYQSTRIYFSLQEPMRCQVDCCKRETECCRRWCWSCTQIYHRKAQLK